MSGVTHIFNEDGEGRNPTNSNIPITILENLRCNLPKIAKRGGGGGAEVKLYL